MKRILIASLALAAPCLSQDTTYVQLDVLPNASYVASKGLSERNRPILFNPPRQCTAAFYEALNRCLTYADVMNFMYGRGYAFQEELGGSMVFKKR